MPLNSAGVRVPSKPGGIAGDVMGADRQRDERAHRGGGAGAARELAARGADADLAAARRGEAGAGAAVRLGVRGGAARGAVRAPPQPGAAVRRPVGRRQPLCRRRPSGTSAPASRRWPCRCSGNGRGWAGCSLSGLWRRSSGGRCGSRAATGCPWASVCRSARAGIRPGAEAWTAPTASGRTSRTSVADAIASLAESTAAEGSEPADAGELRVARARAQYLQRKREKEKKR